MLEGHHEVLVHERVDDALLVRIAHHRVVRHGEEGLHGVGPLAAHGGEQRCRIAGARLGQQVGLVGYAFALVGLAVEVRGREREQRMGAAPQLEGALLGWQQLERGQLGVAHAPERRPAHRLALVHEAAEGAQDALRLQ